MTVVRGFFMASRTGFRDAGFFLVGLALLGAALVPGRALGQERGLQPLLDKMERLQRDVRALSRQVYSGAPRAMDRAGSKAAPGASKGINRAYLVRVEERLSLLETELRVATGNVEKTNHLLRQISTRLDKLVGDVDFRLTKLEGAARPTPGGPAAGGRTGPGRAAAPRLLAVPKAPSVSEVGGSGGGPIFAKKGGTLGTITQQELDAVRQGQAPERTKGAPGAATPRVATLAPPMPAKPPPVLPKGSPKERYDFARSLLFKGDFEKAARGFEEFMAAHPKQPLTANARYWLGETYYVRGDYRRAADIFLTGFQKSPKGNKASGTLLKLGMSLIGLDKKKEACASFDKLAKDFPDANASIKKRLVKERRRAACR